MLKMISVLAAFAISSAAFAAAPDFSVLDDGAGHGGHQGGHHGGGMHKCMKGAWSAANPSEDQNQKAKGFMNEAKAVFDQHKDGIKQAMHGVMTAWKQYPISKDDVVAAEGVMHDQFSPVGEAMQDAKINTLNVLSADQRAAFDTSFAQCMGHQ